MILSWASREPVDEIRKIEKNVPSENASRSPCLADPLPNFFPALCNQETFILIFEEEREHLGGHGQSEDVRLDKGPGGDVKKPQDGLGIVFFRLFQRLGQDRSAARAEGNADGIRPPGRIGTWFTWGKNTTGHIRLSRKGQTLASGIRQVKHPPPTRESTILSPSDF